MIEARGWQAQALPIVTRRLRSGAPVLVSACTGAGKSIFLALLLRDLMRTRRPGWGPVVVMVPTMALVDQLAATLRTHTDVSVGRWYGPRKEIADIVVVCIPSLPTLLLHIEALSLRVPLLVCDECHRAEASAELIERLQPRLRLGLTATPYRAATGLTLWPDVAYRYTIAEAIAAGDLVPPDIRYWRGDGDEAGVNDATLAMIRDHATGPGVVSATDIADAEWYAGWLTEQGVVAEAIHSQHSASDRARKLRDLRVGRVAALVHVRVLSEGVDLPWLAWLALRASHGRNRVGLVQEVGRVLRTHPGKSAGLVLDPLGLTIPDRVGLEHEPDLVAWMDEPDEEEPAVVREQREREELEAAEEQARQIDEATEWLHAARWAIDPDGGPREGMATPGQVARLRDARGRRWLSAEVRERMRVALERPEQLTRGAASDAIALLSLAARRASEHYARTGSWRRAPRLRLEDLSA